LLRYFKYYEKVIYVEREVAEQEGLIDKMERRFRKKHIMRLNEGTWLLKHE
jgi:Na+/phosphate symporter